MKWSDLAYFFIGVILPTYNLLEWVGGHFGVTIKHWTVKTERDLIIWTHYEKRALHQGHEPKTPAACTDDKCKLV